MTDRRRHAALVGLCAALLVASAAMAEPLSFKEARKVLPRANAKPAIAFNEALVPPADRARLENAQQSLGDVLGTLGAAMPSYGAVAITPSEGLFVEWLNGVGQFHNLPAARAAALAYCNANRKAESVPCEVLVEVAPKGAASDDAITLSGPANAALRGAYRKLKAPKAFAISQSTGNFGFDRGDGGRALNACASAGQGASDCTIIVAD